MMKEHPTIARDSKGREFVLKEWSCPICRESETKALGLRGGAQHHRYGLGIESLIVQCRSCGLIFPDPFPVPKASDELYGDPDKYFINHATDERAAHCAGILTDARKRLGLPNPTVLDVGSGRGELLLAARRLGFDAVGLELSAEMCRYITTIDPTLQIQREVIEDFAARTSDKFDLVVMNAVLEHVHDPEAMVASAVQVLNPGGMIYIDIPNEPNLFTLVGNCISRFAGKKTVYNLAPTWEPFHVYGFNEKALRRLLDKHGVQIEEIVVHGSAKPIFRADDLKDRLLAYGGSLVNLVANLIGMGYNMTVWARKTPNR